MAQRATQLQAHGAELCRCLEDLRQRRSELLISAREEEAERARLAQDLAVLQRRLMQLEDSLTQKRDAKQAFDRVITQTEASLNKIVESSTMLLTVAKRSAQEVAALSPGKLPPPPRVVVDTAA
ncbi:13 kDa deflagellation-inducible isoform B [Micractinium conductrix]|uniref:13 kDa deflagellation-inducible isoform B n=1 Tax=Micractinium conductrix TaxID=554055 RepID=A0A2P6VPV3_9CHLO|nr:13 kDa deflagellation-inducible isoform B [Micractinium conductrix]|eukprot:PSC76110.1 13 kDa deflagellation-inducible isoform B [Micractinium conductrix]